MKRLIPVGLVLAGFLAGLAMNPITNVMAQRGPGRGGPSGPMVPLMTAGDNGFPPPRIVDGKATFFSKEDIEKMFPPAGPDGKLPPDTVSNQLGWDPVFRFTEMRRLPGAGAETHPNMTQIYIAWRGTGRLDLGGKPEVDAPGQRNKLVGATSYRMKPGDLAVIPPNTWHQIVADPGQTFSYHMCHIRTERFIP